MHVLAERYISAASQPSLVDEVARLSATCGGHARLVLTLYSPEDESCLHVFDAGSLSVVERVCRESGLVVDRVAEVVRVASEFDGDSFTAGRATRWW